MNKEDELKLLLREEQNSKMNAYLESSNQTNQLLKMMAIPILIIASCEIYWLLEDIFKW